MQYDSHNDIDIVEFIEDPSPIQKEITNKKDTGELTRIHSSETHETQCTEKIKFNNVEYK